MSQCNRKRLILRSRKTSQRARETQIDCFYANNIAISRTRIVQTLSKFLQRHFCSLNTLESLLKITFTNPATTETRPYIGENLFVISDVLVCKSNKALKTHNIDISL